MKKSFLDAYKTYESVPTRQDISDLNAHFRRRDALYRKLGIVPEHLEWKHILEFDPGSGEIEFAMETGKKPFESMPMISLLEKISEECAQLHHDTLFSIRKAIAYILIKSLVNKCELYGWWGRGQQYLSILKNPLRL